MIMKALLNILKMSTQKTMMLITKWPSYMEYSYLKISDLTKAIENFNLSIGTSSNSIYQARSLFWKGESLYRLKKFEEALTSFKAFSAMAEAKETKENAIVLYHMAYAISK